MSYPGDTWPAALDNEHTHSEGNEPFPGCPGCYPHPESRCHRCGGPNYPWTAPSPLWNAVMRGGSINGPMQYDDLICPVCFMALAEQHGQATHWRLTAQTVTTDLELTTPSGRVWNDDLWLWVDP